MLFTHLSGHSYQSPSAPRDDIHGNKAYSIPTDQRLFGVASDVFVENGKLVRLAGKSTSLSSTCGNEMPNLTFWQMCTSTLCIMLISCSAASYLSSSSAPGRDLNKHLVVAELRRYQKAGRFNVRGSSYLDTLLKVRCHYTKCEGHMSTVLPSHQHGRLVP